ncbi:MAG: hypothetical protein GOMPHAMPRED_004870 [Gomphillus americanus]|uniref:Mitochondrial division protein 1 n=1 Tax=Gomphillus americanus TaxID=1940652 RepID=A0A8H3I472_9LECA|nr:MAG: hypothetical protein GOMPHAMPRED_004870 [Gomphillus americanus]
MSITFSPDGQPFATGSNDGTIRLWNALTGTQQRNAGAHASPVTSMAFSLDGKLLASGSWDQTVHLWDLVSGILLCTYLGHTGSISSVAFSPDDKILASGGHDATIVLWNVSSALPKVQQIITEHTKPIKAIAFSPDGRILASGDIGGTIRLWDVALGVMQPKCHCENLEGPCTSLAFLPDSKVLVCSSGGFIKLWKVAADQVQLQQILGKYSRPIGPISVSSDGELLASGAGGRTIKLWDLALAQNRQQLTPVAHSAAITYAKFSPDGKFLATLSEDYTIKLWNSITGQLEQSFGYDNEETKEFWFSDDSRTISTYSRRFSVRVDLAWTVLPKTKHPRYRFSDGWLVWNSYRILWLPSYYRGAFAQFQDTIAFGLASGTIILLELSSDELKWMFRWN